MRKPTLPGIRCATDDLVEPNFSNKNLKSAILLQGMDDADECFDCGPLNVCDLMLFIVYYLLLLTFV